MVVEKLSGSMASYEVPMDAIQLLVRSPLVRQNEWDRFARTSNNTVGTADWFPRYRIQMSSSPTVVYEENTFESKVCHANVM